MVSFWGLFLPNQVCTASHFPDESNLRCTLHVEGALDQAPDQTPGRSCLPYRRPSNRAFLILLPIHILNGKHDGSLPGYDRTIQD